MAITADFGISFDQEVGTELSLFDSSVYTSPDAPSSVEAVRVLFGAVNKINGADDEVTELKAWTEYQLNQETTINGRVIPADEVVMFAADHTLTGDDTATETGYYGQRITWTPSSSDAYAVFVPSQTGYTTSGTTFDDNAFSVNYELYTTEYVAGTIDAGTYIVKGTEGDFIEIGAEVYYVGEVFTKDSLFTFTGTSTVCLFSSEKRDDIYTNFQSYAVIESYLEALCDPFLVTNMAKLQFDFLQVNGLYQSLIAMSDQEFDVSLDETQTLLNQITSYWSNLSSVT